MKKIFLMSIIFIQLALQNLVYAEIQWKCTLSDNANKMWTNESLFKRKAVNSILDACKNESGLPESCNRANIECVSYLNGKNTTPVWQCTALDRNAIAWIGDLSSQRDNAALNAKAQCSHKSSIPATCYMHMLTCRNRN